MAIVYKPPTPLTDEMFSEKNQTVFLAGTIYMGDSEDWQQKMCDELNDNYHVFNPRRDEWDSSWKQSIENDQFREQVEWELDALDQCDLIVMCLLPGSQSPISLLELGLHAEHDKMIVYCPEGFWRKGNVDIVCARYGVPQFTDIDELIQHMNSI